MSPKIVLVLTGALLPAAALAQSNPAEKSPEQIRCELNNNCPQAEPVAQDATPTRAWSWGFGRPRTETRAQPAAARPRQRAGYAPSRSRTPVARRSGPDLSAKPRTNLAITFAPGTASFTPDGRTQADKVFLALNTSDLAKKRYLVAGHTDSAGNAELNRELSRLRAQALVEYLVEKGLDRKSFRVRGYGYDRPLDGVSPTSPANRRVEIIKLD